MSPNTVPEAIKTLNGLSLKSIDSDENGRRQVIEATYRLLARLETPFEQTWKFTTTINTMAALQTLIGLGLWQGWKREADNGEKDKSLEELLRLCQRPCDKELLRRLLRIICAAGFVEELGSDRYRPTRTSLALGDVKEPIAHTAMVAGAQYTASAMNLPNFLAKTQYKEPMDAQDTNFMDTNPDRLGLFAFLQTDRDSQAHFMGAMRGLSRRKRPWTDYYDTSALVDDHDAGKPLLVDVGGGHGLDVLRMLERHSGIDNEVVPLGELVLQDLPEVVALAREKLEAGDNLNKVKVMAHDFFEPQPLAGARAYLMRSVLHDWNDEKAGLILRATAAAMERGYSRLLICDAVLPATGASLDQASADIMMMHLHSARERSEGQWRRLLKGAGLEVVNVWRDVSSSTDAVIEAELL
ncbi:S-adenosyl-L-methionine-dependent methyltransferase [Coniochaeta ligniaria NRRL 30616]|uniref:S-adenosyl-L-methionine-dependent methyltransferase n=1 Tax=Coniochaeta ligniaria NRRL 30616 TaxID=1408157 RepID=A0A1J7J7G0_9PEZI|nr:S-adenosyl-L-methionine-dependent methyltransferase [Coniochaeta ligniaria NRRL 30616]